MYDLRCLDLITVSAALSGSSAWSSLISYTILILLIFVCA